MIGGEDVQKDNSTFFFVGLNTLYRNFGGCCVQIHAVQSDCRDPID